MMDVETFAVELPELVAQVTTLGFCVGVFVPLAVSAFCAVIHTLSKVMTGRG